MISLGKESYYQYIIPLLIFAIIANFLPEKLALPFSYIIFFLTTLFLVILLFQKTLYFFSNVLFIIYYYLLALGTLSAESGGYMLELNIIGSPNKSTLLILLFLLLFLLISIPSFKKYHLKFSSKSFPSLNKKLEILFAYTITITVILASFYHLIIYSSPFLLKLERSSFALITNSFLTRLLPSVIIQTSPLVFSLFFYKYTYQSTSNKISITKWIILFAYFFSLIFILGHKFTTPITLLFLLLCFYFCKGFKFNKSVFYFIIFAIALIIFIIYTQYSYLNRNAAEFFILRLTMQGQVPWSLMNDQNISFLIPNSDFCFISCTNEIELNRILTYRYFPISLVEHYKAGFSNVTGFNPALLIYIFGLPITIIIHFLLCYFISIISALLAVSIRQNKVILSLLIYKIYYALYVFYIAFNTSVFSINLLTTVILAILYIFLIRKLRKL